MNLAEKFGYDYDTIIEFKNEFAFLSNFEEVNIEYNGKVYKSTEAAFQAQKTLDEDERDRISLMTAGQSKKFGRKVNLRKDWENVKYQIMLDLTRIKYQNPVLRKKLLSTGNRYLVEGTWWNDRTWGIDLRTGIGKNWLGEILMKVREEIKGGL